MGSYYVGNIAENVTDNIDPAASDVFYILHFDDILNSYGRLKLPIFCIHMFLHACVDVVHLKYLSCSDALRTDGCQQLVHHNG